MAEPPFKRARRPDSKQMWDESDRRAPIQSHERDAAPRERKDDHDRHDHGERDRNRRYRSRSPRESRDIRGGRERDIERGSRDTRNIRDPRGDGKGREDSYKNSRRDGGRDRRDRDAGRDSRNNERRRSRSPRKEQEPGVQVEEKTKAAKKQPKEDLKDRAPTPPVSFRVGGQDHDRMDTDVDYKQAQAKGGPKKDKVEEEPIDADDEIVIEDDGMAAMQAMMGFGGFGTTHQKKVPGNDISAVRKEKKTEYRQYMNRVGGFNRPLSPTRD